MKKIKLYFEVVLFLLAVTSLADFEVTSGTQFSIDISQVEGLDSFTKRPKIHANVNDNDKSIKVLNSSREFPCNSIDCLFKTKIVPGEYDLTVSMNRESYSIDGKLKVKLPEITSVDSDIIIGNTQVVLTGNWLGNKRPSIWLIYEDSYGDEKKLRCKVSTRDPSATDPNQVLFTVSKRIPNGTTFKLYFKNKLATVSYTTSLQSVDRDVIIVGGGIAGLAAGFFLDKYDVTILEKEAQVGGRAISGTYQGFTYTKGTEYMGKPEGALKTIIRKLKVETREIPSPMDAKYYDSKFYYGEEAIAEMLIENSSYSDYQHFVTTVMAKYAQYEEIPDYDPAASPLAELDNMTAGEWFEQEEFAAIFRKVYNVTFKGLFGANIDEVSALCAIPEIAFDFDEDEVDALSGATPKIKKADSPYTNESTDSYSFLTGITDLTDALGTHLAKKIELQATVTGVAQSGDIYTVTWTDSEGAANSLTAKAVILAVPAPIALNLAEELLSNEQKEIISQIEFASYVTLTLFSNESIFSNAFDLAVPDEYFFTDIYDSGWVQRYYDPKSLNGKPYGIGIYIAPQTYKDQSLLTMSEEDILNNVYTDLEKIFPDVREKIIHYDLHRFPYSYPVMPVGAYKKLSRLHEITEGTLQLAGDYMIYPTFEAAADSGQSAAEKLEKLLD